MGSSHNNALYKCPITPTLICESITIVQLIYLVKYSFDDNNICST